MVRVTIQDLWLCVFFLSVVTISCTSNNLSNKADTQNSQTNALEAVAPSDGNNELRNQLEQISHTAQGRVGVTATVLETGETVTLKGKLSLDRRVPVEARDFVSDLQHSPIREKYPQGVELSLAELLNYMVSESDGTACDVLLELVSGPQVVTQYLRDLGVNGIVVANTEKEIGQDKAVQYRNDATPDAAVVLLQAFHKGQGLSESSQALLLRLMTETPTGLRRIKGLLPDGTVIAHKTGTSRTVDGVTAATNDVGLVTLPNGQHLAIAVFVSDSTADDATREAVIAKVARAAWDEWSQ